MEDYVNERAFNLIFLPIFLYFFFVLLHKQDGAGLIFDLHHSKSWSVLSSQFQLYYVSICSFLFCFCCATSFRTSLLFSSVDWIAFLRLTVAWLFFFDPCIDYFLAKKQMKEIISKNFLRHSWLPYYKDITWFSTLINLVLIFNFIFYYFSVYFTPTIQISPISNRGFCSLTDSDTVLSFSPFCPNSFSLYYGQGNPLIRVIRGLP